MRLLATITIASLVAVPLLAQTPARPDGWQVRFDRAGRPDSAFKLETMRPGWHMTTNASGSGIAWQPSQRAAGAYTLEVESYLFPREGHAEGFGVIFGGRDLDAATQSYYYFLINKDGQFLVNHRAGTAVHPIVPWTATTAVARPAGSDAKNTLAVQATADSVTFTINGTRVHAMARPADADGLVGLRVNHGINVHVTRVTVR
jgi:hypothetical protein